MSRSISCIIVEDEPIAVKILGDYIAEVPFLKLVAICNNALEAMKVLKDNEIDLIFLDLHLPRVKGLDFLKSLSFQPQVIITTAYHNYALESYQFSVVDYLLKPIDFHRFLQAINKVEQKTPSTDETPSSHERSFRFFNVNKKKVKVFFDEVIYIESIKDYCRLHLRDKALMLKGSLGTWEPVFAPFGFIRVHRSFVVSISKITAYGANLIELNQITIPIGRSYKEYVEKELARRFGQG